MMRFTAGAMHEGGGEVVQTDPTQPQVGPGVPQVGSNAPRGASGSTKPGSILFFPKYTSDSSAPDQVNTLLTVTNTNPRDAISVRVFFVHDCLIEELSFPLVANQSRTLVASRESAGQTGYAIAMAINSQGLPTQFNWLIGNANLRDGRGHEASYNAYGAAKRSGGPVAFNDGAQSADLVFDDVEYDRLPKRVAIDSVMNQDEATGPAQKTDVSIFSPASDLTEETPNTYDLEATVHDSAGRPFSEEQEITCAIHSRVEQFWTAFSAIIGANRPGWAAFTARNNESAAVPLLGLSLTDGVGEPLRGARVMQALDWLETFRMRVPTGAPENPVGDVTTQAQPAAAGGGRGASESLAGSILLYPRFVSGNYGATQLFLTNTHPTRNARLRIFATGLADAPQVRDSILPLPPRQTAVLSVNDLLPNQRGWVMVVAIDNRALPVQFNHLIGSAQVNEASGLRASFNAIAIGKNDPNPVMRGQDVTTAELLFDGVNYDRLQGTTGMAFVPSQAENLTTLGFSRPPASMLDAPNTRGAATVTLYDELIASFGANVPRNETRLNQIRSSVTAPPITSTILPGQHGWLKMLSSTPVISWSLNLATAPFSAAANGAWRGGFSGDGNLHILTVVETYSLKVPATNPGNHAPVAAAETIGLQVEARRAGGTIVRLDGSPSTDEDPDDPLTYQWRDNGVPVSSARIADRRLGPGPHVIRLVVIDGSGEASDPVEQTVNVVDTTAPKISGLPSAITMVTDSESGEAISFPMPIARDMIDGALPVTSSRPSGAVFPLGTTLVTFKARDNAGNEARATLQITLARGTPGPPTGGEAGSRAPWMDNLNDQYVQVGEVRNILLQAADADGDPVTFTLQGAPSYAQIISGDPGARNATLRIAPPAGETSVATNVRVIANDGQGQTFTTLPFRVILSETPNDDTGSGVSLNQPPVAVIAPIPAALQATSKNGAELTLDAAGSRDPDGDPMSFTWYDGDAVIGRGAVITVTLPPGPHSIRLTIFDGKDGLTAPPPIPVEVLPRPLTVAAASPSMLNSNTTALLTITGTGFMPGAEIQFTKEGLSVLNYVSIEEDRIVAAVVVSATPTPGYRDIYIFNPNGATARLRSGLFVNR
ncbi:MAG: HYR domain-containing protein [Blastocatellia bacterium]